MCLEGIRKIQLTMDVIDSVGYLIDVPKQYQYTPPSDITKTLETAGYEALGNGWVKYELQMYIENWINTQIQGVSCPLNLDHDFHQQKGTQFLFIQMAPFGHQLANRKFGGVSGQINITIDWESGSMPKRGKYAYMLHAYHRFSLYQEGQLYIEAPINIVSISGSS